MNLAPRSSPLRSARQLPICVMQSASQRICHAERSREGRRSSRRSRSIPTASPTADVDSGLTRRASPSPSPWAKPRAPPRRSSRTPQSSPLRKSRRRQMHLSCRAKPGGPKVLPAQSKHPYSLTDCRCQFRPDAARQPQPVVRSEAARCPRGAVESLPGRSPREPHNRPHRERVAGDKCTCHAERNLEGLRSSRRSRSVPTASPTADVDSGLTRRASPSPSPWAKPRAPPRRSSRTPQSSPLRKSRRRQTHLSCRAKPGGPKVLPAQSKHPYNRPRTASVGILTSRSPANSAPEIKSAANRRDAARPTRLQSRKGRHTIAPACPERSRRVSPG